MINNGLVRPSEQGWCIVLRRSFEDYLGANPFSGFWPNWAEYGFLKTRLEE